MSKRCLGCMELFGDEFEICPHCGYVVGTHVEEAIHIEPGTLLHDRYIIGKVLGYGGFGVTYLGWDGKLEQKVAIKEYLPGEFSTRMPGQSQVTTFSGDKSEQFRDGLHKFVEEAKRLAKFQNEAGIVKIFDSFEENDTAYIIMEYLDGETLTSYLKREKTIPEDQAIAMMMPVMRSLQAVHAEGILHRDIAPDNIFLTKTGEVKLIDFGASRYATTSHSRSLTVIIKPGYSPEEQYRSRGDQGPHTDVYALGATLYKMITGKTPPDAMERRAKYENQNKDILEAPHKIVKDISPNCETAILNAMNVRVEDRTPDVDTFIKELNSETPVRRLYGKIKKIDLYGWPLWLKVAVPALLTLLVTTGALLATGVIKLDSLFSEKIVVPDNVVIVPDVEGLYASEAVQQIESSALLASTGGTIQSEYITAGTIILQTPVGGSYMDTNGTIVLCVSSGKGVEAAQDGISTVPYIIWDSKEDAISKLMAAGLGEPEIEEAYDENVAAGQVIRQSIEAGTKLDEGTVIKLVVSIGPESFEMPDVAGKNYEEAEKLLTSKGLVVSLEYEKSDNVPENAVIRQSVKAGEKVRRADAVTLTVSSGKKTVAVADVVGKTQSEAESVLKGQGFAVKVLENYDANVAAGKVISQSPAGGSAQLEGTTVVIYVSKGRQPVKVSLDANGGSVGQSSITVYYQSAYGDLPVPTRKGYYFGGWYTAASGGTLVDSSTKVSLTSNHTLYARWTADGYTVTFDANGGAVSTGSKTVTFGAAYGEMIAAVRTGYKFDGWYTAASGGSLVTSSTAVNIAGNHTLYAHWTANTYTVTFDANGGGSSSSSKVTYGSSYGTLPVLSRDYYNFLGWYTDAAGGSKVEANTKVATAGNHTLYAHWEQKPLSDWVLESEVPSGAQIVNNKWVYTKTETTESTSSSLSGWTQTGSYWKQTGSGATCYATFPTGYDTNNNYYKNFAKSPYTAYDNGTTKREVSNSWDGYIYWHWMYSVSYANVTNRAISNRSGYWDAYGNSGSGLNYKYFFAIASAVDCPYLDKFYCCSQSLPSYNCHSIITNTTNVGTPRCFRFNYYKSIYTDYTKTYQYQKVSTGVESTTEVAAGGGISNVQHYVQYREK